MSASREKKQRQASGPSQKDTQTQQQAQAYRRKATRYTIIGVVVAVLVAALLIYNSGVFQRGKTAAVVGDTNYTVNDVSYYYYMMRNQSFYMYYALPQARKRQKSTSSDVRIVIIIARPVPLCKGKIQAGNAPGDF